MRLRVLLALSLLIGLPMMVSASPGAPTIVTPDQVKWSPGTGPLAGTEMTVLVGDPSKAGPFTIRLRIPDGAKLGAHYHADTERVTVLSGTLLVGIGDNLVESSMTALPAGSFVSIPAGVHHYAMAKGETILQIGGTGPFSMTAVEPAK
ncbi:MAG: cupin domain-containing protein [Candidatus Baltobacteraceae bacterium]